MILRFFPRYKSFFTVYQSQLRTHGSFLRFGGTWLTIIFHLGRSQLAGGPSENYFKILVKRKGTRTDTDTDTTGWAAQQIQIQNTAYRYNRYTHMCSNIISCAPFCHTLLHDTQSRGSISGAGGARRAQIGPGKV